MPKIDKMNKITLILPIVRTNPLKKELRTPKYRIRVVSNKKGKGSYKRDKKNDQTRKDY